MPYYSVDDGYARTGMGAFAPIWTDIPARPAVRPGIVTTHTGPPSRARTITTSAAAVALAGLIGAGLGAAGSAVSTAASVPAFDTTAGAHSADYPAERIDGIAESLAGDPVYLDPSVAAAYTPQTRTAVHDIVDDAPVPLRIVATHMNSSDESGGDQTLLAERIAAETGEDCVVIVIEPNGTIGIAAAGYELDSSAPADLAAADTGLGTGTTPDERLRAVADAAAELDIRADPAAAPEVRTQPLGDAPETGPQIGGVPVWNLLRGAAAGFAGSIVTIGLGGVFMLLAGRGRRLAADPTNEEAHTPWAD